MASLNFDSLNADSKGQLGCTLASLILSDSKHPVNPDEINKLLKAAKLEVPAYWAVLFGNALNGQNITELVSGSSHSGPAEASGPAKVEEKKADDKKADPKKDAKPEKKEEPEPEMDMDMGDLFG